MNKKIPPFAGGQGRSSHDVVNSGHALTLTLLALVAVVIAAVAKAWCSQ